ncbi:MAG: hypothetical protein IT507_15830 [Burkholderiaceae bacterium]|nr:hypothetical protein [Burkholderiaceae bacterium]
MTHSATHTFAIMLAATLAALVPIASAHSADAGLHVPYQGVNGAVTDRRLA